MENAVEEELDLGQLLKVFWAGRWVLVVAVIVCVGASALVSFLLEKKYTATTQVIVAARDKASGLGGLGALASQFGAVASLAGVSLSDDGSKAEFVAVLGSEGLSRRFIEQNSLLPVLYHKQWDAQRQGWLSNNPEDRPTLWKATKYFNDDVRSIREDRVTGLITLSVTWREPELAAEWANGLIELANSHLKARRLAESERNIKYLEVEAEQANVAQVKNAIYSVMESEIQSAMMARGAEQFAFRTVNAAIAPELPSFPNRLLFVFAGSVVGFVLAALYLLLRHAWKGARV